MNVVLVEPEIHWNAGNIGRTCVAAGATLHLVGKLGFRLDAREIRRAGLDYWEKLDLRRHDSLEAFLLTVEDPNALLFFSTKGKRDHWQAPYSQACYMVFGSESRGLPTSVHERFAERFYRIPISEEARSLNLSTAAGIVLYEGLRQSEALRPRRRPFPSARA